MKTTLVLSLVAGCVLGACSSSPLYTGAGAQVTPGNIPRDTYGEPVWALVAREVDVPARPSATAETAQPIRLAEKMKPIRSQ
jgi:hypothetical protein